MAKENNQSAEVAELKKQCDDCCKKIAALKKEIAALKKQLASTKGGADPRVDELIKIIVANNDYTTLRNIYNKLTGGANFQFPSLLTAFKNVKPTVDSFKDPNFLATLEEQFKNNPKTFNKKDYYNEYKDLIDEAFDMEDSEAAMGRSEDIFNTRTEKAYEQAQAGELGSDLQIRTNPTGYYTDEKGKVTNTPQTSGQALTMAENLTFADIENSNLGTAEKRRLGAALMEARALAADSRTTTDATGQVVSNQPLLPAPPMPTPGPVPRPPGSPIITPTPTPTPFPGEGIIGAVTDPRFVGPNFPGVPNYFNQGIADPRFQRFFQIANQFPTTT